MWAWGVCVCVCVCVRERGRESARARAREREREKERERERERENLNVGVDVGVAVSVWVLAYSLEYVFVCMSLRVCFYVTFGCGCLHTLHYLVVDIHYVPAHTPCRSTPVTSEHAHALGIAGNKTHTHPLHTHTLTYV